MSVKASRVALIHDWLTGMRGGEKVLEVLCDIFPEADVFTLVHLPGRVSPAIERHRIVTSPLQRLPGIGRLYRHLLPIMPWAIERFNFSGYDALISTSHCVAKAAKPPEGIPHWSYCHTPMRYLWDQYEQYFGPGRANIAVRAAMSLVKAPLQRWDLATVPRVQRFFANSRHVQARIQRIYGRESTVIYPPVEVGFFRPPELAPKREPFYLIVSAMAPYKRLDLALAACARLDRPLVVIGEGQEKRQLERVAPPGTRFLGWQSNEDIRDYLWRAKALLFPGEEDFGIVPVEAMAAGCPVIAYGRGGALETVQDGLSGLFFSEPTVDSLCDAMQRCERSRWDARAIVAAARSFDRRRCEVELREAFKSGGIL